MSKMSVQDEIDTAVVNCFVGNPREYASRLIWDNVINADEMVLVLLKAMSHEDVRQALDANELSPRFI